MTDLRDLWRVPEGQRPDLWNLDPDHNPKAPRDKEELSDETDELIGRLSVLQSRLWAESRQSLLLVLQALDAGGKDGTIRKVFTGVNPQGVEVTSFKQPSTEELAHDFLWRIHHHIPPAGEIGVFNRSHYEDVLVARVEGLVPPEVWKGRYDAIRDFERHLGAARTRIVKVYLHISKEEQGERFRSRLHEPDKRWKFARGDLVVREKWDEYWEAYADAIHATSTSAAPWYLVPANDKRYRDWVVLQILVATLEEMDPQYPDPEDDLDKIKIT